MDLLNGKTDVNKNYGEEPLYILAKIVQQVKPPETVKDVLPLIPPPQKKKRLSVDYALKFLHLMKILIKSVK